MPIEDTARIEAATAAFLGEPAPETSAPEEVEETPEATEEAPEPVEAAAETEEVEAPAPAATEEAQAEESRPPISAIAAQEKKFRAERDAFRQERIQAQEKETELRTRLQNYEEAQRRMQYDPAGFIKSLGADNLADIATQLWNQELGDEAPDDVARQASAASVDARFAKLEAENKQLREYMKTTRMKDQQEATQNHYKSTLAKYVNDLGDGEFPFLRVYAKSDMRGTVDALFDTAARLIDEDTTALPDPKVLAEQVDRSIEQRVSPYLGMSESKPVDTGNRAPQTLKGNQMTTRTKPKLEREPTEEERIDRATRALLGQEL